MGRKNNYAWEGFTADIGDAFTVEGLAELSNKLDNLLMSNPEMEKKVTAIIRKFLTKVRKDSSEKVRSIIDNDQRGAYKSIRRTVYRRILGGNINILQRKTAGATEAKVRTHNMRPGQRGGNRRPAQERTIRMESYVGDDRGFILRFFESGAKKGGGHRQMKKFTTDPHRANVKRGSQGGDVNKYGNRSMVNTGNRGSITPEHFFNRVTMNAMAGDMQYFQDEIDKLIAAEFDRKA